MVVLYMYFNGLYQYGCSVHVFQLTYQYGCSVHVFQMTYQYGCSMLCINKLLADFLLIFITSFYRTGHYGTHNHLT